MTGENAHTNTRAEMERGQQALAAARCLAERGFFSDAVSRAYYAAYHAARALLASRGIEPRTHRGTIQLLGLHFVKEGRLSEEAAADLAQLEIYREISDYASMSDFTEKQASEAIAKAERFMAACRRLTESVAR